MGNPDRRLIGIAVSEGVAFGNAYLYRPQPQAVTLSGSAGGDAAQRYVQSLAIAAQQLSAILYSQQFSWSVIQPSTAN